MAYMLRRGSTPTHVFNVPIDLTNATSVFVTYKQIDGMVTVERNKSQLDSITATKITVSLTQAETLSFTERVKCEVQIRAKLSDGSALVSNEIAFKVGKTLKSGVI